jgi:hypothetical protein
MERKRMRIIKWRKRIGDGYYKDNMEKEGMRNEVK